MNGFLERKCADHLDEVLATLEANFNIATGPVQHNWKNPDKISKGSKGFPSGGNTRQWWWTIMNDMEWIRTIERESGFRRCLILYGNVRDLWPSTNGNQLRLADLLVDKLSDRFSLQGTWMQSTGFGFQNKAT